MLRLRVRQLILSLPIQDKIMKSCCILIGYNSFLCQIARFSYQSAHPTCCRNDMLYNIDSSICNKDTKERMYKMNVEELKCARKYFSKLGLMLFGGIVLMNLTQGIVLGVIQVVAPQLMATYDSSMLCSMLPLYLIGYPIMICLICRIPVSGEPVEKKSMSVGKWICAFIMCYAILYLCNYVGVFLTTIIGMIKQSSVNNVVVDMATGLSLPLKILIMVIAAPIVEEFVFRKLLVDRVLPYGEGLAIVMSGLVFGIFHGNLNQFTYTFVMGAFLAYIYIRTRKIIYVIAMHMGINFMGSVVAGWIVEKSGYMEFAQKMMTMTDEAAITQLIMENAGGLALFGLYALALLIIVIVGVIMMIVKRKKFYLLPVENGLQKGERLKVAFLNVGMILLIVFGLVTIIAQLFM